eukprot:CAMPEP_0119486536 /NCGR_PEP_ID=MMETSP1344-20130328/12913_1 /TAXON_ID=236787 /ORGANISM="Florenciella parvula, Strain CCMP2471" /LENGTH=60 /DNA_ID=CAMNT_0007521307 /DNA_START=67 /DNA_END=246 /DNA_ORIENTATION=-
MAPSRMGSLSAALVGLFVAIGPTPATPLAPSQGGRLSRVKRIGTGLGAASGVAAGHLAFG